MNLLTTKFYRPPLPAGVIERRRLVDRLEKGVAAGAQVTLISAPAGFGKTTCVCQWLEQCHQPAAWLTLESADDDPARFFMYLVAGLRRIDERLGEEIWEALQAGQVPPAESILTSLLNDLAALETRVVYILEDLHVIQDEAILRFLERLIARQPGNLHLGLITREDPALPLARLRVAGKLNEIRAEDLRFDGEEIARFLNQQMGLSLEIELVRAIGERTEGWAAGLQLAGLSLRGRSDSAAMIAALSGNQRHILNYLTEEVMSRLDPGDADFLVRVSLLERLSGGLCDAVAGTTDGTERLERFFASNLFLVALDDEQRWFRFHHLFADLLRARLARLPVDVQHELRRRAGRWLERNGDIQEAVPHYLAGGAFEDVVRLLENHALGLVLQGYARTVEGWMRAVPEALQSRSPRANLAFAWMHLLRGNYALLGPYLEKIEVGLRAMEGEGEETKAMRAEWLALTSNLLHLQGKAEESIAAAEGALALAGPENHFIRGSAALGLGGAYRAAGRYRDSVRAYQEAIRENRRGGAVTPEMLAATALMLMATQHGQLRLARDVGEEALERLERPDMTPPPIAGAVYGALGFIYYEWNDTQQAEELFTRGEQLSAFSGHNASLIYMKLGLARLALATKREEEGQRLAAEAAELATLGVPAWLKPELAILQVQIALSHGDAGAARQALAPFHLSPEPENIAHPDDLFYLAMARLLGQTGEDAPAAVRLLERVEKAATAGERMGVVLRALVLRAVIHAGQGDTEKALADCRTALRLGLGEGFRRTFLDEGEPMAALLRRFSQDPYARELIGSRKAKADGQGEDAGMVEPLTEREREVLALIAEGLKYDEIAARLVVSINTVRYFVKEIYGKLGVDSRAKAVETARAKKLI